MPQIQVTHAQTSVPSPLRPLVYASSPTYVHACLSVTEVFNSGSISYFSSPLHSKCVHVTLFSLHLYIFFLSILTTSTVISKCAYVTSYNRLFYVHFLIPSLPLHASVRPFYSTHTHTHAGQPPFTPFLLIEYCCAITSIVPSIGFIHQFLHPSIQVLSDQPLIFFSIYAGKTCVCSKMS